VAAFPGAVRPSARDRAEVIKYVLCTRGWGASRQQLSDRIAHACACARAVIRLAADCTAYALCVFMLVIYV